MRRYRYAVAITLAAMAAILLIAPVLAAYYIGIIVTESDGNSYDMLPVAASIDIDYLADNGFIEPDGRDVRVKTIGGAEVPFMLADNKVLFASSIDNDQQNAFRLSTGNSLIDGFDIVTGDGGYITITDHANLELGNNFKCEFEGYIDTDTEQEFITKGDNFVVWTDGDGTISAELPYYVYKEGYKATGIDWQQGYILNTGSFTDQGTYLQAYAYRNGLIGEGTGVTTVDIDLTDVSTIYIDWRTTVGAEVAGSFYFIASTAQMSSHAVYDAQKTVGEIDRQIDTLDVSGLTGEHYLRFHAYASSGSGSVNCFIYGVWFDTGERLTPKGAYVNTAISTGDKVAVWTSDTYLGIDINGDTKDTDSITLVSYLDNSDNWLIDNMPYISYYEHTTSDTLRLQYQPDDIITGTTLPNELDAGTYDGAITYGTEPAGVAVSTSGLETYEINYPTDAADIPDIIAPTTAPLFDVDLERLAHNPLQPVVALMATELKLTERLVWLGGGFILLFIALVLVLWKSDGQLSFTAFAGLGVCIFMYLLGIFPLWTAIVFTFGAVAALVYERVIAL